MNRAVAFPLVATILVIVTAVLWVIEGGANGESWMNAVQWIGTLSALIWVVYQGVLQQWELRQSRQTADRENILQIFNLIKPDLEDLTRSIELVTGGMGDPKQNEYERRFLGGERTAYVPLLTAKNGERIRKILNSKPADDQLRRRLRTYATMFRPLHTLAEKDDLFSSIVRSSPHGRVYLAINAALASDEEEAKSFIKKLAELDTNNGQESD